MSFKIKDCRITVSFYFFIVLCICSFADNSSIMYFGLLSALFHELGHILASLYFGLRPKALSFTSAGLIMNIPNIDSNKKAHIFIALAGCFTNFFIFLLSFCFFNAFAAANLTLCILNLLPCDPFDGGIVVRIILEKYLSERKAENAMIMLTLIFLTVLIVLGVYVLFRSKYNFSLLTISILIFITICQRTLK